MFTDVNGIVTNIGELAEVLSCWLTNNCPCPFGDSPLTAPFTHNDPQSLGPLLDRLSVAQGSTFGFDPGDPRLGSSIHLKPGLGSQSRMFLAPWGRSRSLSKKIPGAGAAWEKNEEPEPLGKKIRNRSRLKKSQEPEPLEKKSGAGAAKK